MGLFMTSNTMLMTSYGITFAAVKKIPVCGVYKFLTFTFYYRTHDVTMHKTDENSEKNEFLKDMDSECADVRAPLPNLNCLPPHQLRMFPNVSVQ